MMSLGPGWLTGSERVPWLSNRDLKMYITHWMFPIWHARQWGETGEINPFNSTMHRQEKCC